MRSALLALVVGCGPPVGAHTYVEAARLAETEPARAAALCVATAAEAECIALTAATAAKHDATLASSLCESVREPVWRDECFFLVAENTLPHDGAEAAAGRCASAGRFADNCLMHVWRHHATTLQRAEPPAVAAATYSESLGWTDGVLTVDPPLENRFWGVFWAVMLEGGPLDTARCDPFDDEHARRCRQSVPATLQRALNRSEQHGTSGGLDTLCADSPALAARVASATGVEFVSNPLLDAVATQFVERRCRARGDPSLPPRRR
jgi:hypothetical protein